MELAITRLALIILLAGLVAASGSALAQSDTQNARPQVNEQSPYGRYLTDHEGRSLYLFENDEPGAASTCTEECANAWPPYTSSNAPRASADIDPAKLGTVEREGSSEQVTYGGWPLYYFKGDKRPGDVLGQDVENLGGKWYLVSPEGDKVTQGGRTQSDTSLDDQ